LIIAQYYAKHIALSALISRE